MNKRALRTDAPCNEGRALTVAERLAKSRQKDEAKAAFAAKLTAAHKRRKWTTSTQQMRATLVGWGAIEDERLTEIGPRYLHRKQLETDQGIQNMSIECEDLHGRHAPDCQPGKTVMGRPEPQTREEVEAFLLAKLDSGGAETGLYDLGLGYVVVYRCGPENKVSFQWFDEAIEFNRLIW